MRIKSRPLPHFNRRPPGTKVDTLVIHSMYAKGEKRPLDPKACIRVLDQYKVSAHYIIDRLGGVWLLVGENFRAWHAGESRLPKKLGGRSNLNDFSIGIELLSRETTIFTKKQYLALSRLTLEILGRHPIKFIAGHEHIAPKRKQDPGALFDWSRYRKLLISSQPAVKRVKFA